MMRIYRIKTKTGTDFGIWEGENAAAALARMFQRIGYNVRAKGDTLYFPSPEISVLCGDLKDWMMIELKFDFVTNGDTCIGVAPEGRRGWFSSDGCYAGHDALGYRPVFEIV